MLPHIAQASRINLSRPSSFLSNFVRTTHHTSLTNSLRQHDFIMSILASKPSSRDARTYLASFGIRHRSPTDLQHSTVKNQLLPPSSPCHLQPSIPNKTQDAPVLEKAFPRRTALVKVQGSFTDYQLDKIARQLVYLEKLGLASVIVVSSEHIMNPAHTFVREQTLRFAHVLEQLGGRTRPILHPLIRVMDRGRDRTNTTATTQWDIDVVRSVLRDGEFPIIAPVGLDASCRTTVIHANDIVSALAYGLTKFPDGFTMEDESLPLVRLLIVNNEGGVPSYARAGSPHLLINLAAEYQHIRSTFDPSWHKSHPSALSNLSLAQFCLSQMPPESSALITSPSDLNSMIGSLITNKPALSPSLPPLRLQRNFHASSRIATLVRSGLPIRVVRSMADIERDKLTNLLEASFDRRLDQDRYYSRLETTLDFAIIIGDYAGVAIVTEEGSPNGVIRTPYLDKFAVLPRHQGDGTVDFLWIALHDESYGLGQPYSANPNGGKGGHGIPRDLFWRSRLDNPVNKWYFERSSGHMCRGEWVMFWCDAEHNAKTNDGSFTSALSTGRMDMWSGVIGRIPSSWR